MTRSLALLAVAILWISGCAAPAREGLEGDEPLQPVSEAEQAQADLPAEELTVFPLDLEGVRGGRIVFSVDASSEIAVERLLDFDSAEGNRAWAKSYEVLERSPDRVRARWKFEGKLGLNPTCDLDFTLEQREGFTVIRYRQVEPVFGLAAFFGEYQIHPLEGGRSLLSETIYIDSGVAFANATEEDIAAGLREDARLLRKWMQSSKSGKP